MGRFAGEHILAFLGGRVEGDAADGGFGFRLDALLGFRGAVPVAEEEAAFGFQQLLEFVVGVHLGDHAVAEGERLAVDVLLDVGEELFDVRLDAVEGKGFLGEGVAAGNLDGAVLQVALAYGEANGDALEFVLGEFPAGLLGVAVVVLHGDALRLEFVEEGLYPLDRKSVV